jgi:hypothetical protein
MTYLDSISSLFGGKRKTRRSKSRKPKTLKHRKSTRKYPKTRRTRRRKLTTGGNPHRTYNNSSLVGE